MPPESITATWGRLCSIAPNLAKDPGSPIVFGVFNTAQNSLPFITEKECKKGLFFLSYLPRTSGALPDITERTVPSYILRC